MMDRFRLWYFKNYSQITWFMIGFLIAAALNSLSQGNYTDAAFSFLLALANYYLNQR